MSSLRIAYFIDDFIHGGTQTWLAILVEGLHRLGYKQRVYCMQNRAHPQNVQRLQQWANVSIIGEPRLWAIEGLVYLYRQLKQWQPDIVQTVLPTSDMIGRSLGHLAGIPVIVSSIRSHNTHKSWRQLFWGQLTARWACRIVFNSQEVIPFALAREGVVKEQVVYIPNGTYMQPDIIRVKNLFGQNTNLRKQLGLADQIKVLGMVARLDPRKGHKDLLSAYSLVIKEMPETVLLIIGDGALRKMLERETVRLNLAAQVHFLGDRSDILDLLAAIDVYVHSSVSEGMPNAVMEAMAVAKPVVATRVGGITELVIDKQTGWLVEPGHPTALAERIVFALRHQAEARRMGLAAAERIKIHFSAEKMVMAYHTLYQELVSERAC